MRQTNLLTKEEAETYMKRTYMITKMIPVKLFEEGKQKTYYQVFRQAINNRWYLCDHIEESWLK